MACLIISVLRFFIFLKASPSHFTSFEQSKYMISVELVPYKQKNKKGKFNRIHVRTYPTYYKRKICDVTINNFNNVEIKVEYEKPNHPSRYYSPYFLLKHEIYLLGAITYCAFQAFSVTLVLQFLSPCPQSYHVM